MKKQILPGTLYNTHNMGGGLWLRSAPNLKSNQQYVKSHVITIVAVFDVISYKWLYVICDDALMGFIDEAEQSFMSTYESCTFNETW